MNKRLIIVLLSVIVVIACAFGLTACFGSCKWGNSPNEGGNNNIDNSGNQVHTHSLSYVAAVSATCTKSGKVEYWYCSGCGKYYSDESSVSEIKTITTPALKHDFKNYVNDNNATCTANATETSKCSRCEATDTRDIVDSALGHDYGEWEETIAATCSMSGKETRYCVRNDDHIEMRGIEKLDHTESNWLVDRNASCDRAGSKHTECIVCHVTIKMESIEALSHKYSDELNSDSVNHWNECSICLKRITEVHNLNAVGKCTECGYNTTIGLSYRQKNDGTYSVIGIGVSVNDNIVIPATYNGNAVTEVASSAFIDCGFLLSIVVPDSVYTIGAGAFSGCGGLKSLTLPFVGSSFAAKSASVSTLFGYVFGTRSYTGGEEKKQYYSENGSATYYIPSSLKSVTITGGNIFQGAFYGCDSITCVDLGDEVLSIGVKSFYGCKGLEEIKISNKITTIESGTFSGCISLTDVNISDSVKEIGENAFYGCGNLKSLSLSSALATIKKNAFGNGKAVESVYYRGNLESWLRIVFEENSKPYGYNLYIEDELLTDVTIPDSINMINNYAFTGCVSLTGLTVPDVTVPNSLTTINKYAFSGCTNLEKVITGNRLISIDEYAFNGCSNLTEVEVGIRVTSIGNSAFKNCSSLSMLTIPFIGAAKNVMENTHFGYIFGASNYLQNSANVPESLHTVIVTSGEMIGYNAFNGCKKIKNITIPETVTSIGRSAFLNCNDLTSVYYEGDISGWLQISFGDNNSTPLSFELYFSKELATDIAIPANIVEIKDYIFSGCISLQTISMHNNISVIGNYAFYNCSGLTGTLVIPNGVTAIGNYAFYNCNGFIGVLEIPDNVFTIGSYAFYNNSYDKAVIGANITSIDNYAFNKCNKLIEVHNKSIVSITIGSTDNGFVGYYALNVYTQSNGESKLHKTNEGYIFYADDNNVYLKGYCGNSTDLVLPESYNGRSYEIYRSAFENHYNLTSIKMNSGITAIGSYAFYNCTSLTRISINEDVLKIGNYAFYNCAALTEINFNAEKCADFSKDNYVFYCAGRNANGITVNIGGRATKIPAYLFYPDSSSGSYLPKITTLTIGRGVIAIGNYSFYNCKTLREINFNAENCADLDSGNYVFYYAGFNTVFNTEFNDGITVNFGVDVSKIPARLFRPYNGSDYINVGCYPRVLNVLFAQDSKCKNIGASAFFDCRALKSITIPDSATSIGASAFMSCLNLQSITIPNSVTYIGASAFYDCPRLSNVTFENTNGWWVSTSSTATSGTNISSDDLSKTRTASDYLRDNYKNCYWKRT